MGEYAVGKDGLGENVSRCAIGSHEDIDGILDRARHLVERAQDRSAIERRSLPERYIEHGLGICFFFGIAHAEQNEALSVCEDWCVLRCLKVQPTGSDELYSGEFFRDLAQVISREDGDVPGKDQQVVLIPHVEGVESAQYWVPSVIRFERANRVGDIRAGELHLSVVDGSFKSIQSAPLREWEHDFVGTRCAISRHSVKRDIQGSSQIVDCVPDYQREIVRYGLVGFGDEFNPACAAFYLDNELKRVFRQIGVNSLPKIVDVTYGPLNLT